MGIQGEIKSILNKASFWFLFFYIKLFNKLTAVNCIVGKMLKYFVRKMKIGVLFVCVIGLMICLNYLINSKYVFQCLSQLFVYNMDNFPRYSWFFNSYSRQNSNSNSEVPLVDDLEFQGINIFVIQTCDFNGNVIYNTSNILLKRILPFSVLYVTIISKFTSNCRRRNQLQQINPPQNFSIGLGKNHLIQNVFIQIKSRKSFNRVHILIYRQERILPMLKNWIENTSNLKLKRCVLYQSCSYIFNESKPCNIFQPNITELWIEFINQEKNYSYCDSKQDFQSTDFHWSIPCLDCSISETCLWSQSIWTSGRSCSFESASQQHTSQLSNIKSTKIVFIGDSTIRGLYFSLLKQLNGSLNNWSKSHSLLQFRINHLSNVSLAYSYYPKFWEPESKRPELFQTLRYVTNSLNEFESDQIIFVIGGVQWLNSYHITEIKDFLDSSIHPSIRKFVIIKEHGAGFHVPTSFVSFKPKKSRNQMTVLNEQLIKQVDKFGFVILPSYRMTWSRLDEFYPGTCACHFHTVKHYSPSSSISVADVHISRRLDVLSPKLSEYQIIGSIHKTYFNILKYLINNFTVN